MVKLLLIIVFLFIGCSTKQPIISQSAMVIFKTPVMKFYDKGFVTQYNNYTHLQIFNLGSVILDLKIYPDKICTSTLFCMPSEEFNTKYLNYKYKDDFMFKLFRKNKIYFKDKKNNILIKVIKNN
jgi:hypothetical protein